MNSIPNHGLLVFENNLERSTVQFTIIVNLIEEGDVMNPIPTHMAISGWTETVLLAIGNNHENVTAQNSNLAN